MTAAVVPRGLLLLLLSPLPPQLLLPLAMLHVWKDLKEGKKEGRLTEETAQLLGKIPTFIASEGSHSLTHSLPYKPKNWLGDSGRREFPNLTLQHSQFE